MAIEIIITPFGADFGFLLRCHTKVTIAHLTRGAALLHIQRTVGSLRGRRKQCRSFVNLQQRTRKRCPVNHCRGLSPAVPFELIRLGFTFIETFSRTNRMLNDLRNSRSDRQEMPIGAFG